MIYSWQKDLWSSLAERFDRMPHALLLTGPAGVGKREFAESLAKRMLCETVRGDAEACGACPSCNWFSAGNHPDFRLIEPGGDDSEDPANEADPEKRKKSEQIRIHQIRALDNFLGIGTHRQGARIIIIQSAEAMNPATANALLKVLEEPNPNTLFILITNNKKRLLPTVLSRCWTINFPKPSFQQSAEWLKESGFPQANSLLSHVGGMPLAAAEEYSVLNYLNDFYRDLSELGAVGPVTIAGRWESWLKENMNGEAAIDRRSLVTWMQKWVLDLIVMKLCGSTLYHLNKMQEIFATANRVPVTSLFNCYNELLLIKAVAHHPLNPRLFLEDLLSRYARAVLTEK